MPKSLRDIAVENADKKNITSEPKNFCSQCGEMLTLGMPHGHYNVPAPKPVPDGKSFDPKPFK